MTHGNRGIVMVADADAKVRHQVMSDLRKAGYTTVGYHDLTGALTYLALGERLDVLVTGAGTSGGRDGLDLAHEAKAARPRLSVIYVSATHPGDDRMVAGGGFVRMPFKAEQVTAAVSECLAARTRRAA